MKTRDVNDRRIRYVRTPTGKKVTARERELTWFQALANHGPLPSHYLHEFTKGTHADHQSSVKRLRDLYHETDTPHGGAYLTRPQAQRNADNNFGQRSVYDLDKGALKALGGLSEHSTRPHGSFSHQLMVACTTASIELATFGTNVRYIHGHELLARSGATLAVRRPTGTPDLIPDQLFALEYNDNGEKKYRSFLVECDRGTEPVTASSSTRKSYARSLGQYRQFIGKSEYKTHYGLNSGMMVLNVMNKTSRKRSYLDLIQTSCNYMLFQTIDHFGEFFTVPDLLPDLFNSAWERSGAPAFRIDLV